MSVRRVPLLVLACLAIAAAILAGCGGGGANKNVDVGPAAAVPENAALYLDATVRPTGSAQADVKQALGKVLNTGDPGAKIMSLLNKSAKKTTKPGETFTVQQDVLPWLGQKVGLFADSLQPGSQPTLVFESTNNAAALASERKDSRDLGPGGNYKGHPYDKESTGRVFGTVGNFAIYGPLDGFQHAVDAFEGSSLGDSSDFKDSVADLPSDRLGTLYTVPKTFIDALGPAQVSPSSKAFLEQTAGESLSKPVSGALTATPTSFQLEATGGNNGVETPQSSLLGTVPSDSWLVVGIGHLGDVVKGNLDQLKNNIPNFEAVAQQIQAATGASLDQLTGALGDAVIYVDGTTQSTAGGALVGQTKDASLTGRLLGQLQSLLQLGTSSSGGSVKPLQLSGGGTGFQINFPRSQLPQPVEIAQQGDKIVIGYGAGSAERSLTPPQTLSSSEPFSTATGQVSALGTDFFLDIPKVLALAEASGATKDPQYLQAKPYLDALSYLVTGSGTENNKTAVKAVVGLK